MRPWLVQGLLCVALLVLGCRIGYIWGQQNGIEEGMRREAVADEIGKLRWRKWDDIPRPVGPGKIDQ